MSSDTFFPSLAGWEPTHQTLHWYSKGVGVVPRAHALAHPKWWHISLKVKTDGLVTDNISLPSGGIFNLKMDLHNHQVILAASHGDTQAFEMTQGISSTAFADRILSAVADLGLGGEYAREKFENDDPREYDPDVAEKFFTAVVNADRVFKKHQSIINGETGPIQLWPHGFDLAFEWFGTCVMEYEEHGKDEKYHSQINLGFSLGEPSHPEPYFYSNPWPFETDQLVNKPLLAGAQWFTEGWQGSILEYADLADDSQAEAKLLAYAKAVYDISSPTLTA